MCGIAGIFSYGRDGSPVKALELETIQQHMHARGPDGSGTWVSQDHRLALGHRRLAIIDPLERASQPMRSADGRLVITFNGEIYNHHTLRTRLEAKRYRFRTTSDTEVLLHLYAEHGTQMVRDLRGMYAFAIWDEEKRGLLTARDPYGIKPFYYANDGQTYRFASQVRALAAGGGISTERDPAGIVGFMIWGSVPEPFTIYRDVRALPAGATQWVDAAGPAEPRRFASITEVWAKAEESPGASISDVDARCHDALRSSVRHHLVADVPVGAFLSAGVDSGALVGLIAAEGASETETLTLSFEEFAGSGEDEVPLAKVVAQHYGVKHHVRVVTRDEFERDVPAILNAMDQPTIDGMNTWFVSKATAELGLKVAVSGLGGDELFGGYASFVDVPRWVSAASWQARIPNLGRVVRAATAPALAGIRPKVAGLLEYGGSYAGAYLLRRAIFMPWELSEYVKSEIAEEGLARLDLDQYLQNMLQPEPSQPFTKVAALEAVQYMRNQLLRDTDWASMAHSLEIRVPLVDYVLLKELAPLAPTIQGRGKKVLGSAPTPPLPRQVVERPKSGFGTPINRWLSQSSTLSAWKSVPHLARKQITWNRKFAYALLKDVWL